ncbi:hypothetical protein KEN51_CDS0283 [Pseudomonas phage vB_Pae10145-KEN51]
MELSLPLKRNSRIHGVATPHVDILINLFS